MKWDLKSTLKREEALALATLVTHPKEWVRIQAVNALEEAGKWRPTYAPDVVEKLLSTMEEVLARANDNAARYVRDNTTRPS